MAHNWMFKLGRRGDSWKRRYCALWAHSGPHSSEYVLYYFKKKETCRRFFAGLGPLDTSPGAIHVSIVFYALFRLFAFLSFFAFITATSSLPRTRAATRGGEHCENIQRSHALHNGSRLGFPNIVDGRQQRGERARGIGTHYDGYVGRCTRTSCIV